MQLETCDLEDCHFWQCELHEYDGFDEFLDDTDTNETFRSKGTKLEKGCLIQLLPRDWAMNIIMKKCGGVLSGDNKYEVTDEDHERAIITHAKYIYPPKVEMSPYDCKMWIADQMENFMKNEEYKDYIFDKVLYWKLVKSSCILIKRDKKWFEKYFAIKKKRHSMRHFYDLSGDWHLFFFVFFQFNRFPVKRPVPCDFSQRLVVAILSGVSAPVIPFILHRQYRRDPVDDIMRLLDAPLRHRRVLFFLILGHVLHDPDHFADLPDAALGECIL